MLETINLFQFQTQVFYDAATKEVTSFESADSPNILNMALSLTVNLQQLLEGWDNPSSIPL